MPTRDTKPTEPTDPSSVATSGGAGWFLVIMAGLFLTAIALGFLTG